MKTKLISGIASIVVVSSSLLVAGGSIASAASSKCGAANRGRVAGNQVCAYSHGKYKWIRVVAQPTSPTPAPKPVAAPTVAPSAIQMITSADGAWSVAVPSNWSPDALYTNPNGLILYPSTGIDRIGFSFTIHSINRSQGIAAELGYSLDSKSVGVHTILGQETKTINGTKVAWFSYIRNDTPTFIENEFFVANTAIPGNVVRIQTRHISGAKAQAQFKADIDSMIATLIVR